MLRNARSNHHGKRISLSPTYTPEKANEPHGKEFVEQTQNVMNRESLESRSELVSVKRLDRMRKRSKLLTDTKNLQVAEMQST